MALHGETVADKRCIRVCTHTYARTSMVTAVQACLMPLTNPAGVLARSASWLRLLLLSLPELSVIAFHASPAAPSSSSALNT